MSDDDHPWGWIGFQPSAGFHKFLNWLPIILWGFILLVVLA